MVDINYGNFGFRGKLFHFKKSRKIKHKTYSEYTTFAIKRPRLKKIIRTHFEICIIAANAIKQNGATIRAIIKVRPVDTTKRLAGSDIGSGEESIKGEIEEGEKDGFIVSPISDTSDDTEVDGHEFH